MCPDNANLAVAESVGDQCLCRFCGVSIALVTGSDAIGDLDNAIVHYTAALEIDPKHKNAHEYIGEAYLALGDVESAETHLEALDKICLFSCAAYRELKRAIKAYKKNLAS